MKTKHNSNRRQRCIIVGGAPINDYERIRKYLSTNNDSDYLAHNPDNSTYRSVDDESDSNIGAGSSCNSMCGSNVGNHIGSNVGENIGENVGKNAVNCTDYCIFCDSGILHNHSLQMRGNLLVGDFDSCPKDMQIFENTASFASASPFSKIEKIIRLPKEKDDTDTAYAVKYALKEGYRDFILIGCYGALSDHSLANLGLLKYIKDCGGHAVLLDDYSIMEVLTGKNNIIPNKYRYFSLLPIYGRAKGVDIENAKYSIKNRDISIENPFTVSNETLDTDVVISIECGALLLIKSDRH